MIFSLVLCGCSSNNSYESESLNDGEYAAILPYEPTDSRVKHISLIQDLDVRMQIENGLMELSKKHFPTDQVAFKTHNFLDYDELDATDGSRGLLGTLRDDNPNGLNPSSNEEFDTGNGVIQGGVILVDLYELDWYQKDKLKGLSIGLVVNDVVERDGKEYKIKDENMKNYIEVTCTKLVSYLRERFNEINLNIPIYIAVYGLNHDEETSSNGGYMYEGFFQGNNHSYDKLDEEYILVPSSNFKKLDPDTSSEFEEFKNKVVAVIPDSTYVVGEARFEKKKIDTLNLEVTTHGKMTSEVLACVQAVRENMKLFESTDCEYRVKIINNDDVFALLHRPVNSKECSIILAN